MDIDDLLAQARAIWPATMTEQEIVAAMGVVFGDVCRYVRDYTEGKPVDVADMQKELGNMLFSTIRWCDDLGLDAKKCIQAAIEAQQNYQLK